MLARAWHRVRQFVGALRPRVSHADRAAAYHDLPEPLRPIFESMTLRDQQHGIVVWRRVHAASPSPDPALFTAALIHDCGKGRVQLWHRIAHVVLEATTPALAARIAIPDGPSWRRTLWRLREHPRLGADMAAAASADPETVRLIREQDAPSPDPRLALLQAADDA